MTAMEVPDVARDLASTQYGVVGRRQLLKLGVSPGQIRWSIGRSWRQLLPGVVLLDPGLPTIEQRHMAALIYAGPRSWLAGPTALRLHGVSFPDATRRIHVFVPETQRGRDVSWVTVRRTSIVDERIVHRGPLRISSLPRALVDTAALAASEDTARCIVIEAVQRRLVRLDDVAHWIEVRQSNGRLRLRRALTEAAAGAWSVPEADLARLMTTSHLLPDAWHNPGLSDLEGKRLTTPDLWFDDVGMAVMVHSRQFHAGTLQWDATVDADDDLSANRVVVIGVTPGSVARDPAAVLRRVEAAYSTARQSGVRAPVKARSRTTWARSA